MPDIEHIKRENTAAISNIIHKLDVINYETVSELLPTLLATGQLKLDASVYTPADPTTIKAHGIGRHLVYEHPDQSNPLSIWVFALAPRQKTSIHDHKCDGTVTVLEGPVSEKTYETTEGNLVRRKHRTDRYRFHTNADKLNPKQDESTPKDGFIHQLKRRKELGEGTSITLHIYKMEAHLVQEGLVVDNRNLNKVYTKDKSVLHCKEEYEALHNPFQPR